jgi:hypothetical protein
MKQRDMLTRAINLRSLVALTTRLIAALLWQQRSILFLLKAATNAESRVERPRMKLMRRWHFAADQPSHCRKQQADGYSAHQHADNALERPEHSPV